MRFKQKSDFNTKIALTIAIISYCNCLYMITRPELSPPEAQLLDVSIVLLTGSTQKLLQDKNNNP
jgi:hypothetical protein